MTLEQYKEKLDEELKAMDWHERDIKNSRAYKVLSAAALDRENVPMEEWLKLNAYFTSALRNCKGDTEWMGLSVPMCLRSRSRNVWSVPDGTEAAKNL